MIPLLLFASIVPALAGSCQPVTGTSILARNIAHVVPAFSTLPPEKEILAAPIAGVERVLTAPELERLAQGFNLAPQNLPLSVCFEQETAPLTAAELLPALEEAFASKDASRQIDIKILEFSNTPIPQGKLQFTRGGLEPSGLWHGRVIYAAGRSMSIWAKVRVMEETTWVEAAELLPAGKLISVDQLVLQTGLLSPLDPRPSESLESVVGKKPLRMLAPGTTIRPRFLIEPPQVEKGDKVAVQVSNSDVLLQFDAEAETPGHIGDLIFLRNPENGRRFQARVEGKGKVAIRR